MRSSTSWGLLATSLLVLGPRVAPSEVAYGDSRDGPVDPVPPVVTILLPGEDEQYYGGNTALFAWTTYDAYPGTGMYDYFARILANGDLIGFVDYHANPSEYHWWWPVPDIVSGNAYLEVTARDAFGNTTVALSPEFSILLEGTPVPETTPDRARLLPPYPNPCNPAAEISFELPGFTRAEVTVYDLRGRLVRRLLNSELPAGRHSVVWRGRDDSDRAAAAGVYAVVLRTGTGFRQVQKVVLVP